MNMLHVYAISHKGRLREENQDAFLINGMVEQALSELKLFEQKFSCACNGLLCAVADGMGGHQGGSVASKQVLGALALEAPRLAELKDFDQACEYLRSQILAIHRQLLERGAREPELSRMGTTLLGVYLRPEYALCFHVGDSRLYRYRGGTLMQLTSDHRLKVSNNADFADSTQNPKSGALTNCLGCKPDSCSPEFKKVSFQEKDILLLCSDGLSDMVELEAMDSVFDQDLNLAETARKLVTKANEAGGLDNITLVLIN